jgi:hypothetical protein
MCAYPQWVGSKVATTSSITASNRNIREDIVKSTGCYAALLPFLLFLLTGVTACGSSGGGTTAGGGGGNGGGGSGGGGAVAQATIINVSGGQTTTGVNIAVASPASSPTPNAESLGTGNTASNTGATISQGTTATVLLFGPGLNGNMRVTISGPGDITVTNIQSVTATDKTPGISFTAAVAANAALGARTVLLRDLKDDITSFTGGFEVQ